MSSKLRSDEADLWRDRVVESFEEPFKTEYLTAFARECLTARQIAKLTSDDLRELGIRLGHRSKLLELAEDFVMQMSKRVALVERRRRRQSMMLAGGSGNVAMQLNLEASSRFSSRRDIPVRGASRSNAPAGGGLTVHTLRNKEGVEWISMSGSSGNLQTFLTETHDLLTCFGFPTATFHRFFFDNKPMPFADFGMSSCDGPLAGILLRVPDVTNTEGSSVTVITNRFVVLLSIDENVLISYQRCIMDCGETAFHVEWGQGRHEDCDMGLLLERMLRKVLKLYEVAVAALREMMDDAMGFTDEVAAVQALTLVMKKASIFKRCAMASRSSLEELLARPMFELLEHNLRTVCDRLRTVESLCEELEGNALSSVDLNIALAEFRSSTNLKIFTYITIVAQPIALATGWYGMNFTMPEFDNDDGYYIFIPVVWVFSLGFLLLILWRERRLLRLQRGYKEKQPSAMVAATDIIASPAANTDDGGPQKNFVDALKGYLMPSGGDGANPCSSTPTNAVPSQAADGDGFDLSLSIDPNRMGASASQDLSPATLARLAVVPPPPQPGTMPATGHMAREMHGKRKYRMGVIEHWITEQDKQFGAPPPSF